MSSSFNFYKSTQENWPLKEELFKYIEFDKKYFPFPWTQKQWLELKGTENYLFVSCPEENAFSLLKLCPYENLVHLLKILVHPLNRKSGVAEDLLKNVLIWAKKEGFKKLYLEVEDSNENAKKLYLKLGAKILNKRKNYYGASRDGLMMELRVVD